MSRARQSILCLAAVLASATVQAQPAGSAPANIFTSATNRPPFPLPAPQSPVSFFRQLLTMSPAEQGKLLAGRTPESRARIMAKIHEYQALGPDECELRLRATELRWYLTPLMRIPPAARDPQLAMVPAELHDLAQSRLTQWDLLPPPLQQEFLANDRALNQIAQPGLVTANSQAQQVADQFGKFFELTPPEKDKMLGTLSELERAQMEKTLKTFYQLPPQQRALCVRNYAKFAGMSAAERAAFLKNAEQWSKMSPQERQTWRDLVANIPLWPPLPPAVVPASIMPPLPPHAPSKTAKAGMATN